MKLNSLLLVPVVSLFVISCGEQSNLRTADSGEGDTVVNARHSSGDESGFLEGIFEDPEDPSTPQDPIDTPEESPPEEETPIDETPVDEDPVDEDPVDEDPVDEDPIDEDPVDEDPVDEDIPEDDTPVVNKPKKPGPGQSPGQTPGQSPYQGVTSDKELSILDLSWNGSGCPEDSVSMNISDDEKAFTLLFSEFTTEFSGASKSGSSVHCRVYLDLDVPQGWQVSLMTVDLRGVAELNVGQSALFVNEYKVGSVSETIENRIDGPTDLDTEDFEIRDEFSIETWSACGGRLPIEMDLSAHILSPESSDPAYVAVDSADGELTHTYGLVWRKCD